MRSTDILDLYRQLADSVSKQRNAAIVGEWEALAALEIDCGRIIDALGSNEPLPDLSFVERDELMLVLSNIIKDRQEVRKLAEEGRSQLAAQIKSIKTEQKIMQAYGGCPEFCVNGVEIIGQASAPRT
jgi:hypothetical protein